MSNVEAGLVTVNGVADYLRSIDGPLRLASGCFQRACSWGYVRLPGETRITALQHGGNPEAVFVFGDRRGDELCQALIDWCAEVHRYEATVPRLRVAAFADVGAGG